MTMYRNKYQNCESYEKHSSTLSNSVQTKALNISLLNGNNRRSRSFITTHLLKLRVIYPFALKSTLQPSLPDTRYIRFLLLGYFPKLIYIDLKVLFKMPMRTHCGCVILYKNQRKNTLNCKIPTRQKSPKRIDNYRLVSISLFI